MTFKKCPVCQSMAERRFRLSGYNLYNCNFCGHEFSDDFTFNQVDIYDDAYFKQKHRNWFNNPDIDLFETITTILKRHIPPWAKMIDVGCGYGDLLNFLYSNGYRNLTGLDIVDVKISSIPTIKADIFDYKPKERYEVVFSMANIEHILNPIQYMETLDHLLQPGGLLIVYTVNSQSLIYHMAKLCHHLNIEFPMNRLYDCHHLQHFSAQSLKYLVSKYNLKYVHFENRNVPMSATDLPPGRIYRLLKPVIKGINIFSEAIHMEMLQLAILKKPSSE